MNIIDRFAKEQRFPELPYRSIFNSIHARSKLDTMIRELENLRYKTTCSYLCLELGVEEFEAEFEAFREDYVEKRETTGSERELLNSIFDSWGVLGWICGESKVEIEKFRYRGQSTVLIILGYNSTTTMDCPEGYVAMHNYRLAWLKYIRNIVKK